MLGKFFFKLFFKFKSKQGLLGLAIFSLFLSSFALLVLQSTMGGLQTKLVGRSKSVSGDAYINIRNENEELAQSVYTYAERLGFQVVNEYQIELMLRYGNMISPIVVHGIDTSLGVPDFLNDKILDDLTIGRELSYKLNLGIEDEVSIISPGHVNSMMGDIPRSTSLYIGEIISTDVSEIDQFHAWVRIGVIQNLIRKRAINTLRIFGTGDFLLIKEKLKKKYGDKVSLVTWEEENHTLVYALKLESIVMVFLFIAMTILVSFCITSGLMIFLSKIKYDLTSLWILGASEKKLFQSTSYLINIMGFLSVFSGIIVALIFLFLLDRYGIEIMPAVFVDRKIPIVITAKGILVSSLVPFGISYIFSKYSLIQFKKDTNHIEHIKSFG